MKQRIAILDENGLKIKDITDVIETMDPLEGAVEFLDWLRERTQIIIVSDTFTQFAGPLMKKLGRPTLFCNTLSINSDGMVKGYQLRQQEGKKRTVQALKSLDYKVTAFGDSYNDIGMLKEADCAALFRPPKNVVQEFPEFEVTTDYDELKVILEKALSAF